MSIATSCFTCTTTMPLSKHIGIIVLLGICVTSAIRNLKEGPTIGSDSRQYKIKSLLNEDPTVDFTDVLSSRAAPVQVLCTERSMILLISADLHSNGRRVTSEELSLGWSAESCKAYQYSDTEYVIKADLHQCGSELLIEGDNLVYSNQLIYTPMQNSFGIVRTSSISIPIECHYKRIHFVSSTDVKPSWEPFTSTKSAVELISFSFRLMNDDWRTKRSSYVYHLGEVMNIQASFLMAGHSPLRLVMEKCVVTLEHNAASVPRYMFIQNHGCLIDSKVPDSSARFMSRKQNHVLQMQMDAFRFHEDQRNTIYITCQLKIVDLEVNIMNKACTYSVNRWLSVDGWDEVCECCENTCDAISHKQTGKWSRLPKWSVSRDTTESNTVMLGPITVLG
ncbi:zona pellucida sperm-binding protein 3-like [Sinocyclocheilus grahami]|uniref:Zona pellucida sperm-binding protein 3 n=1 Tax=Sinocyclocheilus grahami TaxID=75366 RepID=A0A672T6U3_SINGR|nr:PREDICTED: zona pellucida sperm-binding protein 3-like [Sinocyclocheilus grahami]